MKRVYIYIVLLTGITSVNVFSQQMPLFTNYLLNAYAFNPAVVGSNNYIQANMNYRNQWTGFDGAPKTYMASLYGPFRKSTKVGFGGMISADITGLLQRTGGYLTYAYHIKINDAWKLGMALSAGATQYRVRLYDAKIYDKDDQVLNGSLLSKIAYDVNAGFYLYRKNAFIGLSAYQANNKVDFSNSNSRLTPHIYVMAGYTYKINKKFGIQPSTLIKYNAPVGVQPEFSVRGIYMKQFWAGFSYRMNDAYSITLGGICMERISIAYAYDLPFSGIRKYTNGSHELMLVYSFIKTKKQHDADEEEFNTIDNSFKSNLKNKKKPASEEGEK
jgi:type IX secretion system PorP/SprF family membrane protein